MHAWFAAAADTRWRAVAPLIGMQSFGYALEKGCFHARVESIRDVFEAARDDMGRSEVCGEVVRAVWDKICPGLVEKFDCAQSLRLLKHRPVFIGNGELDARCPTEPVWEAVEKVRGEEGGENMVLRVYEGVGHEVTEEMWGDCVAFFEKWFGKEGVAGVDGAVEEVRCPVAGVDVC
ncbi:unnamed protein product [Chondrus crispus]|uniref:Peptidase S9 prolyl oligopeptidase catalytic domain-containing protein n=1 Tax=Chondrus crispus TaxID=2769 RepID=R7Q703_CHOCR|nr:unnamed protein product [Chondrus crispus]CDF33598.1 unnamed protein product [Chondrus crispus]|eukprot:XP_005713401.1 unnamed protein product [Chondrus crispus]